MSDSIIQEVRTIRDQHAASMGYDLDRIYADLKARQEKHKADGWVIVATQMQNDVEPHYSADFAALFGSVDDETFTRPGQSQHSDSPCLIFGKPSCLHAPKA